MTVREAQLLLTDLKINPNIFSIGKPHLAECLVIDFENGEWITYDWEKGSKANIVYFDSEDEAANSFVDEVRKIDSLSKA